MMGGMLKQHGITCVLLATPARNNAYQARLIRNMTSPFIFSPPPSITWTIARKLPMMTSDAHW
jgi:hypothetical protein